MSNEEILTENSNNVEKSELCFAVDIQLAIEKLRVATQVRNSHLKNNGREDKFCIEAYKKLETLEQWIDDYVSNEIKQHPAYPWFSRVKGVGKENIGKVIGSIDIHKAPYISSLWKYAGFHVEDGRAPKPKPGEKLEYNKTLRTMVWRLASSLMRARGKYYNYYLSEKEGIEKKLASKGIKIVPENDLKPLKKDALEKYLKMFNVKKVKDLPPQVQREFRNNPVDGFMSEGQVHNRALRKMSKLFLSHFWVVTRQVEGLPMTLPYAQDVLGHQHYIDPWEFVEK